MLADKIDLLAEKIVLISASKEESYSPKTLANTGIYCYNHRYRNGLNRANPFALSKQIPVDLVMKPLEKYVYSRAEVLYLTTFSRWKIDDLESKGEFPKRIKLSANRIGWVVTEVDDWFAEAVKNADR